MLLSCFDVLLLLSELTMILFLAALNHDMVCCTPLNLSVIKAIKSKQLKLGQPSLNCVISCLVSLKVHSLAPCCSLYTPFFLIRLLEDPPRSNFTFMPMTPSCLFIFLMKMQLRLSKIEFLGSGCSRMDVV